MGAKSPPAQRPTRPRDWGPFGRRPLVVLAGVALVASIDKGVLPGVLPRIQDDLGLSDFEGGLLGTAFLVATLLLAVPSGFVADRRSRRAMISIVLLGWAVLSTLTSLARSFGQLFAIRAALGVGEAVNDPASQSLVADYYPAAIRGRAYAVVRATPTAGTALGLGLGAAVGAAVGWRSAFLLLCVPGSLIALAVRRLPEPARGASDGRTDSAAAEPADRARLDWHELWRDVRAALRVPSLRALVVGVAVIDGALAALAFWALTYYERVSGLSATAAGGIVGLVILFGAVAGTLAGGAVADRIRDRVAGAPMLLAGGTLAVGAVFLFASFLDGLPTYAARLPLQLVGVLLIVGALPATAAVTSEVVPPGLRSSAFALIKLSGNVLAAAAPAVLGLIADSRDFVTRSGEVVGDLGFAFRVVTPLILLGGVLILFGRRHVERDRAAALAAADLDAARASLL